MYGVAQEKYKESIFDKIRYFLSDLFAIEEIPSFTLQIPKNILLRTELLCKYISEDKGYSFNLENFLMLLYLDFIKTTIKEYNPEKVFKMLSKSYYDNSVIKLSNGIDSCLIDRTDINICNITITMDEDDLKKGQLVLEEIFELYKHRYSFSRLMEALWLNFIDGYKRGENKKAYQSIVKLLEKCFE